MKPDTMQAGQRAEQSTACNQGRSYAFFQHRECEYFPCHGTDHPENFNCLFCYCPLYALGDQCGGNFSYTENGIKDCSSCKIPHEKDCYDYILSKMKPLQEIARKGTNSTAP